MPASIQHPTTTQPKRVITLGRLVFRVRDAVPPVLPKEPSPHMVNLDSPIIPAKSLCVDHDANQAAIQRWIATEEERAVRHTPRVHLVRGNLRYGGMDLPVVPDTLLHLADKVYKAAKPKARAIRFADGVRVAEFALMEPSFTPRAEEEGLECPTPLSAQAARVIDGLLTYAEAGHTLVIAKRQCAFLARKLPLTPPFDFATLEEADACFLDGCVRAALAAPSVADLGYAKADLHAEALRQAEYLTERLESRLAVTSEARIPNVVVPRWVSTRFLKDRSIGVEATQANLDAARVACAMLRAAMPQAGAPAAPEAQA